MDYTRSAAKQWALGAVKKNGGKSCNQAFPNTTLCSGGVRTVRAWFAATVGSS